MLLLFCQDHSLEVNNSGNMVVHEYAPAYKLTANASIDVDLSKNLLAPDFTTKGGQYLYPQAALQQGQKNVVRIKMTRSVPNDFRAANEAAGFNGLGNKAPSLNGKPYTWHHLDDLQIINGEAYCTMQLVEQSSHTRIVGMTHTGGVSQYRVFYGNGYN